jgi:small GTP-binding protein
MLDAFKQRRMAVVSAIAELVSLAEAVGARTIGQRLRDGLIRKLEADRFNLVVVGEFNRGKTTLVNALLGSSVFAVGVTPTTAVIHNIEYSDTPRASAEYESGQVQELGFDAVGSFAVGNPAPDPDPGPVNVLNVGYPASILRNIALVDTPGVNDLSLQRADITYNYIPQSDAVLFLLDAGQLLTASERVFLQDKLLGQSRDKIVFVVTKKDILSEQELAEAMRYAQQQLATLVTAPRVFAVSAEQALDGGREDSGIDELVQYLNRFLSEERGRILIDNALGEAVSGCILVGKGIDARRRGLQMSAQETERRIAAVQRELDGQAQSLAERRSVVREEAAAIKAWARRDLDRLVDDVSGQVPGLVDKANVEDLKVHLGPFLEKSFRDWAQGETREIADALEALAEKTITLMREDASVSGKRLAEALGGDLQSPTIAIDTFAYDIGVAALPILGLSVLFSNLLLGGMLILASPLLAIYMRGRIDSETRQRAKQLAPAALRDAAQKVAPKIDEMVDEFARRLDEWVVNAGEEVYREVIEVLAAATSERAKGDEARSRALSECDEQSKGVIALKARYETLRSELWIEPASGGYS